MSSDHTWKLNGIDLDTALGDGFISDVSIWRPGASTRRSVITLSGIHGAISPGLPIFDEARANIGLRFVEQSQAALEERVNHIRALFGQPSILLGRVSGGVETSAVAKLESISDDDYVVGVTNRMVIQLAIPGAFMREAVATSDDLAFSADLVAAEVASLSGSSAPVTDAVVRVTGPATTVSVTDPSSGTGIYWAGALAAGQYLFLAARPLDARISANAADWTTGGTSELANVSFPAVGRLQLWPVVQSPTVRKVLISATGSGRSAATKLAVRAGRSYL